MVSNIRIATPCTADWNLMAGDDRIRHCAQCNRNVYNFAAMTRAEVDELIANREGHLCARLYQRGDGTVITRDCSNPFQVKIRQFTRVAGIALSAATMSVNLAAAQTTKSANPSSLVQIQEKETGIATRIIDPTGAVILKAKVSLRDSNHREVASGFTDDYGRWEATDIPPGDYTVSIDSPGFQSQHATLSVVADRITQVQLTLLVLITSDGFTVTSPNIEPETLDTSSEPPQIRARETGIDIQIHDQSGAAIPKAKISFKDNSGKKHSGSTDKDGKYSFSNLDPGQYKLKMHVSGIPSWEQQVTVVRDEMMLVQLTPPVVMVTVGELY